MIHAQVGSSLVSRHYPAILLAVFREGATSPPPQIFVLDHWDPPQNLMLIRATMMSVHMYGLLVHPKLKTVLGLR